MDIYSLILISISLTIFIWLLIVRNASKFLASIDKALEHSLELLQGSKSTLPVYFNGPVTVTGNFKGRTASIEFSIRLVAYKLKVEDLPPQKRLMIRYPEVAKGIIRIGDTLLFSEDINDTSNLKSKIYLNLDYLNKVALSIKHK